jgi:pyrimidine deaminase RibD-like protein
VQDIQWMRLAIRLSLQSMPVPTAFCVGALLVLNNGTIFTGYSREQDGNTHAEQVALTKATLNQHSLMKEGNKSARGTMYTTLQPCLRRLSGNKSCVDRLCESAMIDRVVCGALEPPLFVQENKDEGMRVLEEAGIQVTCLPGLNDYLNLANQHCLE